MRRASKNMTPVSIRLSIYLDPRGGSAVADTIKKMVQATLNAFNGNITATANALGYSNKTVRRILGGIDGELKTEGKDLRVGDSETSQGSVP